MDDTLRLSRGVLLTQDGPILVKRIGKGAFSVAMATIDVNPRTGERDVFVFSDDDTSDKELLSMAKASGYDINFATLECAREAGVRPSVADALETLVDTAANYGAAYQFEFSPRNLATDARGNLVLLDVLFDKEALLRRRESLYDRAQALRINPSRPRGQAMRGRAGR